MESQHGGTAETFVCRMKMEDVCRAFRVVCSTFVLESTHSTLSLDTSVIQAEFFHHTLHFTSTVAIVLEGSSHW